MSDNFIYGLTAVGKGAQLFFLGLLGNGAALGFAGGIFVALMATGFIIAENPSHVPYMLRYSSADSFQKLASKNSDGTFDLSYSSFTKTHRRVRLLFLIGLAVFLLVILAATMGGEGRDLFADF